MSQLLVQLTIKKRQQQDKSSSSSLARRPSHQHHQPRFFSCCFDRVIHENSFSYPRGGVTSSTSGGPSSTSKQAAEKFISMIVHCIINMVEFVVLLSQNCFFLVSSFFFSHLLPRPSTDIDPVTRNILLSKNDHDCQYQQKR